MKRRHRARQCVKWTAAMATVLLLIAWIVTGHWRWVKVEHRGRLVMLCDGTVVFSSYPLQLLEEDPGWYTDLGPADGSFEWWFNLHRDRALTIITIPLWPLILLTGIPALWMFRTDRRRRQARREGLCPKCGYDLRGHSGGASGSTCPECGWNRGKMSDSEV